MICEEYSRHIDNYTNIFPVLKVKIYKLTVSATLTHKYVQVDVDGNNKSDRPEWASARYHAYYSPNAAFELQLQWMVATGPILQDLVNISTDLLLLTFKNLFF